MEKIKVGRMGTGLINDVLGASCLSSIRIIGVLEKM